MGANTFMKKMNDVQNCKFKVNIKHLIVRLEIKSYYSESTNCYQG